MTDENIFSNPEGGQAEPEKDSVQPSTPEAEPSKQEDVKPPEPVDPNSLFADQLSKITTDDGRQKYADVSTALDSIPHAQTHIKTLTKQIEELRMELDKKAGMEEVLQRIESNKTPSEQPQSNGFDETDVEAKLDALLQKREQQKLAEANKSQVVAKLNEMYGEKASSVFEQKAKDLGLDVGTLSQIAMRSPKAVLEYFNSSDEVQNPSSASSINTANLKPSENSNDDYMKIFKSSDTGLIEKWHKAAPKG